MNSSVIPDIILKEIQDKWVRENFFRIQKFLQKFPLFRGEWTFFELSFKSGANQKIAHGLNFTPTDIIQTSSIGPGILTWNYDLFDGTFLNASTTGACTIRAFIGAYKEEN